MFTDLVGYTALTEREGPLALELVKKNRNLHKITIEKYNGKLVKELGDGYLAIFEDVVKAVNCAIEIQEKARENKLGLPIRIGIHFGEVTIENGDIFGHGVNMASRIQSIADPGGIYLSKSLQTVIDNQTDFQMQHMGAVPLKNIKDPIQIFALKVEGLTTPNKKRINSIIKRRIYLKYYKNAALISLLVLIAISFWITKTFEISRNTVKKSIAVLTLENFTDDSEKDYLGVSMTEELIRELSRINNLTVISQRSTLQYAGLGKTISDISRELNNVNFVVDGNLMLKDGLMHVTVNLNDALKEKVVWSKEYKRPFSKSRQIWSEVSKDIRTAIGITMPEDNSVLNNRAKSVDPLTYELYLKGMHALNKNKINPKLALSYFNDAIERNPTDPYAWSGVATAHIFMGHGTHPSGENRQKARAAAIRALQLDSTLAEAWSSLGMIKSYYDWEWNEAEYAYRKANELNPNLPWNHYHYSWYLVLFGRMDEAIKEHKKAKELDPFSPVHTAWLGYIYMMLGEYDKAIREAEQAAKMKNNKLGRLILAEIYHSMGKIEEAMKIFDELIKEFPERPKHFFLFIGKQYMLSDRVEEGLKILDEMDTKYDVNHSAWGALQRAEMYTALGDFDNAFKWYQFDPHHHWVPWVRVRWDIPSATDISFADDPRFAELMRKFNLPDPAPFQYNPD